MMCNFRVFDTQFLDLFLKITNKVSRCKFSSFIKSNMALEYLNRVSNSRASLISNVYNTDTYDSL